MPIDNISVQVDLPVPSAAYTSPTPFEFLNLTFVPHYNIIGEVTSYQTNLRNLHIKIWAHSQTAFITNSLHKFNKGNNYSDFAVTDLKETVSELSDLLHTDFSSGRIRKIEYGVNIESINPSADYNRLVSYKGNLFLPQVYDGEIFGVTCAFKNYAIKAYDKTRQLKKVDKITINEQLLRFEMKVKKMAALHKRSNTIPIYTVGDLFVKDHLEELGKDAVDKYVNTVKSYEPDMTHFSLPELTSYARQAHQTVREKMKVKQVHTYNLDKSRYNRALKRAAAEVDEVGQLLKAKFHQLINS